MFDRLQLRSLSLAATFAGATALACSGEGSPSEVEETGSLAVRLSQIPEDAACLKLSIKGSRTVNKSFSLEAGEGATFELDRLPVGIVSVDAAAYSVACSKVKAQTVASWLTEAPSKVRIDALQAANIVLKLLHNGLGDVSVDFEAPAWQSTETQAIDLALIGDTPYGSAQLDDFPNLLAQIAEDSRVSYAVHLGDIKSGSTRCDDEYFAQIFAGFSSLPIPLIYTPGDNEWTDCHRANNGAYDPIERLGAIRSTFFPIPGLALGGGFKQVLAQSEFEGFDKFVENQIWYDAAVAFGAFHVVGSNDSSIAWYTDDRTGTKQDDATRRNQERNERNAATLDWLDRLFEIATDNGAKGVAILMQADMFDPTAPKLDAFDNIAQRIAGLAKAFGKPVLLVEGDSHLFVVDQPFAQGNSLHHVTDQAPNLTRVVVQGSTTKPLTEWLRLHVDPASPEVFSLERNAR